MLELAWAGQCTLAQEWCGNRIVATVQSPNGKSPWGRADEREV